jgi:hypothetical protein
MIRRRWLEPGVFGAVVVVTAAQACGKDDDRPPSLGTGGIGGQGGSGGRGAGGASGTSGASGNDGGPTDPLAPTVVITSPGALTSPNLSSEANPVLTSPMPVTVVCEVTQSKAQGALAVSPESVTLELLNAMLEPVAEKPTPAKQTNEKQYTANFVLTEIPNGVVGFRCNATDISMPPKANSATISTFVDHGPTIVPRSPLEKEAKAASADFRFEAKPAPLADGDQGAAITGVTLSVAGKPFNAQEVSGSPGTYFVPVNFEDPLFDPKPQGPVPVTITATNSRSPKPITATSSYSFTVDTKGPVIAIAAPALNTVVGGTVELRFTVDDGKDGAGVDDTKIVVSLNNKGRTFDPALTAIWTHVPNSNVYTYKFDSREIKDTAQVGDTVQITVNIVASDIVGNPGRGQDHTLYLDHYPPIVDLDPENVREQDTSGTPTVCSRSFDPVGPDAANDQGGARSFTRFRAIAWDQTNSAPGQEIFYPSLVDKDQVYLYLQPDPTKPLLIDTDHDGKCDDLQATQEFRKLDQVPVAGEAWYGTDAATNLPLLGTCQQRTLAQPDQLCAQKASDLTRVIKYNSTGTVPVIFAQDVTAANTLTCTGAQWQIGVLPAVKEGWLCLAVRAPDLARNVGISRPLRVCYNDDNPANGEPSCPQPGPSCAENCVLPPKFTSRYVSKQ